jgi:hypothetical protein
MGVFINLLKSLFLFKLQFFLLLTVLMRLIFNKGAERNHANITRESIMDSLEKLGQFYPGLTVPLKVSMTRHQVSHQIWPTII